MILMLAESESLSTHSTNWVKLAMAEKKKTFEGDEPFALVKML